MHWSQPHPVRYCAMAIAWSIAATPAAAQQHDEQLWLQANTIVPLNDDLRLTLEQIARFGDRPGGLYTTEFGGIVGYKLADNVEVGFGYRYVDFYNGNTARRTSDPAARDRELRAGHDAPPPGRALPSGRE